MGFKKQAAGTQRTLIFKVRFKPEFKEAIAEKLAWLRSQERYRDATVSEFIRLAVFWYCKQADDPREP